MNFIPCEQIGPILELLWPAHGQDITRFHWTAVNIR